VHNSNIIYALSNSEESNNSKSQKSQTSNNADIKIKKNTNLQQLFHFVRIEWATESISSLPFHFTLNRRRPHILGKRQKQKQTTTKNGKRG